MKKEDDDDDGDERLLNDLADIDPYVCHKIFNLNK